MSFGDRMPEREEQTPELYELQGVTCTDETLKAIQCRHEGRAFWVPKSLIDSESDVRGDGDSGSLVVPEWWLVERGLV